MTYWFVVFTFSRKGQEDRAEGYIVVPSKDKTDYFPLKRVLECIQARIKKCVDLTEERKINIAEEVSSIVIRFFRRVDEATYHEFNEVLSLSGE